MSKRNALPPHIETSPYWTDEQKEAARLVGLVLPPELDHMEVYDGDTGELIARWTPAALPMTMVRQSPPLRLKALKNVFVAGYRIRKGDNLFGHSIYVDGRVLASFSDDEYARPLGLVNMDSFVQLLKTPIHKISD